MSDGSQNASLCFICSFVVGLTEEVLDLEEFELFTHGLSVLQLMMSLQLLVPSLI